MDLRTHPDIDRRLCGEPVELGEGFASVELKATPEMVVDEHRLVHGGFVFGLADHAAMLAVNHPNVVLGQANSRFLKPVREGEILLAVAEIVRRDGRKKTVQVEVRRGNDTVMSAELVCYELDHHVLQVPSPHAE
ncbi:MAG: PaaI family thioesterase [bacterium]|nr:PaaI family thioesterase [bacterium]